MRQHAGVFAADFSSNLLWQNCFAPKKSAFCAEPRRAAAGILDVCQGGATMGLRETRLLRRMFSYARRPKGGPFFMCRRKAAFYVYGQTRPWPAAPALTLCQQIQHQPIHHAGGCAEHDHRPGHGEHLDRRAGDDALWLCQDRHTVFSEFFQLPPKWAAYCFSLPLQMQTRSKYAYLSQSLLKGTHEPALQNF